jgi:hypothetical protein
VEDGRTVAEVRSLSITNRRSEPMRLVLEPVGEIYDLEPERTLVVRHTTESPQALSIDVADGEVTVWEEGGGVLELEGE